MLLTADDLMRRGHYRNAQRTLDRLLELGMVPVINENDTVATDEIRFGDNDRLAALVAHVSRASALILLSDVDGLYDGDPRKGGARKIAVVHRPARPGARQGGQDRRERRRPGRHVHQGRLGADRHVGGHPHGGDLSRARQRRPWRASRPGRTSRPPASARAPGCCGWPTRRWPAAP